MKWRVKSDGFVAVVEADHFDELLTALDKSGVLDDPQELSIIADPDADPQYLVVSGRRLNKIKRKE